MARYYLRFGHADTGLSPVFKDFKKSSDHSDVGSPPAINELVSASGGGGTYYFDYSPTFDIIYEVDGTAGVAVATDRYIADTISPRDVYLDEPTSQVKTDVWQDSSGYAAGQKGKRVDDVGAAADTSASATLFGKSLLYKESVRGDSAGTSDGNSVKQVQTRLGAPVGASISADIAGVQTGLLRALGLMHENAVLDNTTFNGANKLTAGRLRIYNSKANALAAGGTGLVATYTISATYVGSNVQTYIVVLEP